MAQHSYPGIAPDGSFMGTSDCEYGCGCWMGGSRSGGPDGIDPHGECPNAPPEGKDETPPRRLWLGRVVRVKTGPGFYEGLALVKSYVDHPTFQLERPDGTRFTWVAQLCEAASQEEEVHYWRERALAAEAKLHTQDTE